MRAILCAAIGSVVLIASFYAQDVGEKSHPRDPAQAAAQTTPLSSKTDSDDTRELRADLQRLKILLNQMRTNLAFVQTTQTPLKHQFELEAEAWQVIVERMERRVKHLEDHGTQGKSGRARTLLGPKKRRSRAERGCALSGMILTIALASTHFRNLPARSAHRGYLEWALHHLWRSARVECECIDQHLPREKIENQLVKPGKLTRFAT